jgi:predicted amidohydrolase
MKKQIKAAILQAAPVPLDITYGIERLIEFVADAADIGAEVAAFGETFLGGYPLWLDEAPNAAIWEHRGTQALHSILLDQALRKNDPRLAPLQALVDAAGIIVCVGGHERVRSSLVNTQYIFRPGLPHLLHRKLVPTHGERRHLLEHAAFARDLQVPQQVAPRNGEMVRLAPGRAGVIWS